MSYNEETPLCDPQIATIMKIWLFSLLLGNLRIVFGDFLIVASNYHCHDIEMIILQECTSHGYTTIQGCWKVTDYHFNQLNLVTLLLLVLQGKLFSGQRVVRPHISRLQVGCFTCSKEEHLVPVDRNKHKLSLKSEN